MLVFLLLRRNRFCVISLPAPPRLSAEALVLSHKMVTQHQCSKHGKRSHSPHQDNFCHDCRRCVVPLASLGSHCSGWSNMHRQQMCFRLFSPKPLQHKGECFCYDTGIYQFCSQQHLWSERKNQIRAWLLKHLLMGDEECTDATKHQACRECRMYFPQERFSNLPIASSQIETTRKCIKERINQIERLCSNQRKEWHLLRLPWVVAITSCTTVASAA